MLWQAQNKAQRSRGALRVTPEAPAPRAAEACWENPVERPEDGALTTDGWVEQGAGTPPNNVDDSAFRATTWAPGHSQPVQQPPP